MERNERRVVSDYVHQGGNHCETTALRNVLRHRGLPLTEEMIFGIGGGVGFTYRYEPGMRAPFIGARYEEPADFMIATAGRRLGVPVKVQDWPDAATGYRQVAEALTRGELPIVWADIAYLPYFGLPESAHFGGHCVIVSELDEERGVARLSDCCSHPVTITLRELARARASPFPPFAPRHRVAGVGPIPDHVDLPAAIRAGLRACSRSLLDSRTDQEGLRGLGQWAEVVRRWPDGFGPAGTVACLMATFRCIEISGTGGAAFRTMYARFLDEAARALGLAALAEAGARYREAAELWRRVADAALPERNAAAGRIKALLVERNRHQKDPVPESAGELTRIQGELDAASALAVETLGPSLPGVLEELSSAIRACRAKEEEAVGPVREALH